MVCSPCNELPNLSGCHNGTIVDHFAASARCRYYVSVLASDVVAFLQMACHNKSTRTDLVIGTQDEDKQTAWKAALAGAVKHERVGLADTPCLVMHAADGRVSVGACGMEDKV